MGKKILTILVIIVLIAVLGVIGYIIFNMLTTNTTTESNEPVVQIIKPQIVLTQEEPENGEVIINVTTSTEDAEGIKEIKLPDGSKVISDTAKYSVDKNDVYEFSVIANNGQSASAKITVESIEEKTAQKPYVPNGFNVISDNVDEGFVIEDSYGNQYVWVPVQGGKMTRTTIFDTSYEENNSSATALVNSVAQNYGFYIGRFEASEFEVNGRKVAASMSGKIPWTNISCLDAIDYSNSVAQAYGYEDCTTSLISSQAWDTVLNWIDSKYENYSSSIEYGNYEGGLVNPTGTTERDIAFQICDLAGNVSEWTTEIYKKGAVSSENQNAISRVIRGGAANLGRTPASRRGYSEEMTDLYWGFRIVLFK